MSIKGFDSLGEKSKVSVHKVITDSHNGGLGLNDFGGSEHKTNIPFKSNTAAAINPTTDTDDYGMGGSGRSETYGTSNAGGSSGDGPTPGFSGSGAGVDTLNGAQQ